MRFKFLVFSVVLASLFAASTRGYSQVAPDYTGKGLPFTVGAGVSSWDPDWGQGRMWGVTAWTDWYPGFISSHVHGLGLEFVGRDVNFGQNLPTQKNIRQDTIEGGGIYSWHKYRTFRPFVKGLVGFGSYDFVTNSPTYSHDTRILYSVGGGVDYHAVGPLWVRADYEYQFWQQLLGATPDPQGFTFGAAYNFSHSKGH